MRLLKPPVVKPLFFYKTADDAGLTMIVLKLRNIENNRDESNRPPFSNLLRYYLLASNEEEEQILPQINMNAKSSIRAIL